MSGYRDPDTPDGASDLFEAVGPIWFLLIIAAGIAWVISDLWLMSDVDWPDAYGWHCAGKGCWLGSMWHSPALLHHHKPAEVALFVCIWMPAIAILSPIAYQGLRKLRGTRLSLYADHEERR